MRIKHLYLWHLVGSFLSYINDERSHDPRDTWVSEIHVAYVDGIIFENLCLQTYYALSAGK